MNDTTPWRHNEVKVSMEAVRTTWVGEWARNVERIDETPPTTEELRDYDRARELLDELQGYDCFEDGGPDYGAEVRKPAPHREYIYTETEDEWTSRTDAWLAAGKRPPSIWDTLFIASP